MLSGFLLRAEGFEPSITAPKAAALPLGYALKRYIFCMNLRRNKLSYLIRDAIVLVQHERLHRHPELVIDRMRHVTKLSVLRLSAGHRNEQQILNNVSGMNESMQLLNRSRKARNR